jgi:hypothetical protein
MHSRRSNDPTRSSIFTAHSTVLMQKVNISLPPLLNSKMDDDQDKIQSEGKRRKIRKGTRSCWECKKRKMRCVFADVGSPPAVVAEQLVCIGCQRRGTKCISQEFEQVESKDKPEKPTLDRKGGRRTNRHDRVAKVEALLDQLITTVRHDRAPVIVEEASETSETSTTLNHGIPTPASIDSGSSRSLSLHKPSNVRIYFMLPETNETLTGFARIMARWKMEVNTSNFLTPCTQPCPRKKLSK